LTVGRKSLPLVGLLTFVAAFVALFPARVAYNWFAPPAVQLSGLEGSIWSGSAAEMSAAGLYLRDLKWRLRPLRLLTGKLAASVEASPSSGFVQADIAVGPGGSIALSDVNGSLPLSDFASLARMPGLAGEASVRFEELRIRDGLPVAATGTLAVAGLFFCLSAAAADRVLLVVSSAGTAEDPESGYEFDELTQAWWTFVDNGYDVEIASPASGKKSRPG